MNELRALSARTPLRTKLIAAVLALVAAGLVAMSIAGVSVMRGYLMDRVDGQLDQTVARLAQDAADPRAVQSGQLSFRVPSEMYVEVRTDTGQVAGSADALGGAGRPRVPEKLRYDRPFTVPGTGSSGQWRVEALALPGGQSLVLGISLHEVDHTVGRLIGIDIVVGILVLAGLAVASVLLVRASLRPLAAIEQTAGAIAAGELSRRVPQADPRTEVGRLGGSLNGMLAQIEAAFGARERSEAAARESERRMRRFVADAGHELRTPLTAIRGFAEYYRQGAAGTPAEVGRLVGRIEDAAGRMGLLVDDLLLLARLDRQRPLARRPVDLLAIAAEAVQEARVVAPDRQIELTVQPGTAYQLLGDEARLRQVFGNLLTNATTHTPAGTPVEVRLSAGSLRGAPAAVCEVADSGPGLAPEQAGRVFERFYRADPARTQDGGTGLGLAIVAALVAAHDGEVSVDTAPGEGATFRIVLPLS